MPEDLLDDAAALLPGPGRRRALGLAGPPAAGKSTLAHFLVAGLNRRYGPSTAGYLPLDGFHLSNRQLERRGLTARKGAPETFDVHGYVALLRRSLSARTVAIYVPDYDRVLHEPVSARHVIEPAVRLIVTEGNYLADEGEGWRDVAGLVAQMWFVDAPAPVRDRRLLQRHIGNGTPPSRARARVDGNDLPNAERVAAGRSRCDRVVTSPLPHHLGGAAQ
jgi:pantothenate kinase